MHLPIPEPSTLHQAGVVQRRALEESLRESERKGEEYEESLQALRAFQAEALGRCAELQRVVEVRFNTPLVGFRAEAWSMRRAFRRCTVNLAFPIINDGQPLRCITTLSSQVNLPHTSKFRALCGENLVT
jgi:hypothetical protein